MSPEQDLFLFVAMREMNAFHSRTGHYAAQWELLDIKFGYFIGHRIGSTRPPKHAGAIWKPRECRFSYVIRTATDDAVIIQAVDDDGVVEYAIRDGMTRPCRVRELWYALDNCSSRRR